MTGKHGEVTAVCGTPLETFYRSAYASPMRDDDHIGKRALDGVEGRRRVRETCRMIAERHGLTPTPRSRRGLWALLVDRFGEAKGRQIMRGAKLAVPKPKTVRRPWSAAAKQRHSEKLKFIHAMRRQPPQPPPAAPRPDAADADANADANAAAAEDTPF